MNMPGAGRAVVAVAMLSAWSTVPVTTQTTPAAQIAAAAPAGNADNGKTLFKKDACYQCHGYEGQGGAAGPRLGPGPIPFRGFLAYVRAPRAEMPPYTVNVISDQELADVYAFLQARPRPPAVSSIPLLAR
jgi:mono/diheme cytochrome c family protein